MRPTYSSLLAAILVAGCTLDSTGTGQEVGSIDRGGSSSSAAAGSGAAASSGGSGAQSTGASGGATSSGGSGAAGSGGLGGISGNSGAAGSGGVTGGSGGAGANGGVGGGAGSGPVEDCQNGLDDDGDGKGDCADPDCTAGYECVPEAPVGWDGYFRVRSLPNADPEPPKADCSPNLGPTRTFSKPGVGGCSACSCDALMGGSCSPTPITCFDDADCGGSASDQTASLAGGGCQKPGSGEVACFIGTSVPETPGTCTPAGGQPTGQALFDEVVDRCGDSTVGAGCATGNVCVPRAAVEYGGFVCVSKLGEEQCPAGWGAQVVSHVSGSDNRGCDLCSCTPNPVCQNGQYRFHERDNCSGGTQTIGGSCTDNKGENDWGTWGLRKSAESTFGGSCDPVGGTPTGIVQPAGTSTFCCRN